MKLGTPANGTRAAYCNNRDSARPTGSWRQMLRQLCDQAEGPRRRFLLRRTSLLLALNCRDCRPAPCPLWKAKLSRHHHGRGGS